MYPLPAHAVDLVLQYISPLTGPLPPHLISAPLRQRHHFLQISPSSPTEYLCWPSPNSANIIELLDHLPPSSARPGYPTRYTSDPESIFAHAQISPNSDGLRMLFLWDDIHEPLASKAACEANSPRLPSPNLVVGPDTASGDSDDSYWAAYEAAGHDSTDLLLSPSEPKSDVVEEEDAYWAQYSAVQGSADSTLPSPLSTSRKLRAVNSHVDKPIFSLQDDPIVDVPANTIHSRSLTSGLGPPSPNMLARLLTTISPRRDIYPPVFDDPNSLQSSSVDSANLSSEQTLTDSELVTPPLPHGYLNASVVPLGAAEDNGVALHFPHSLGEAQDKALTDSIKGLFYLWKAGRKQEAHEKDKSIFLRIVQAAIARE